jgi:dipeptidyl aminopeptidase/acylaminoacyl peptidase
MKIWIGLALALIAAPAAARPPLEAYGELPDIWGLDISPSGKRFAYFSHQQGGDYFMIAEMGAGVIAGGATGEVKPRQIFFANDDYAVVIASETASWNYFQGKWENSSAFSFNIHSKKFTTLLKGYDELYPAQSGLGRIIGRVADASAVFMPAYIGGLVSTPSYGLLKARLDYSGATIHSRGTNNTTDWIVNSAGVILAREDYDDKDDTQRIFTEKGGVLTKIFEAKGDAGVGLVGSAEDGSALVIVAERKGEQFSSISTLSLDGKISPPLYHRENAGIEDVLTDLNRVVIGVEYSGLRPSYDFFDPSLTADMAALAAMFPDDAVRLAGWTENKRQLALLIEGGATAPAYFLFDRDKRQIGKLAQRYAEIGDADVNPIVTIEYKARDGRRIPALLTLPRGAPLGSPLPLIVIPHGGPASYDAVGFDWMAQYFAGRGYMIFQPNFRGSDGFGVEHREAGYGEWGGKMQDDVTDGVELLIRKQWVDSDRTCIVGGSYGGYAALAGGAYTPDLYKCVAAIAPVADLNLFLTMEKRDSGADSAIYEYWTRLIGDKAKDKAKLAAASPVNAASNFKAPVLLIHGNDDTIVPFIHSSRMEASLKAAGKQVSLIKLKNEDHWLSQSETRLQTLRELDQFVARTIGAP